jgi:hypothetical protein
VELGGRKFGWVVARNYYYNVFEAAQNSSLDGGGGGKNMYISEVESPEMGFEGEVKRNRRSYAKRRNMIEP